MKDYTPPTPVDKTTCDEAVEQTESPDVGYISKIFVQALFPYRSSTDLVRQVQQGPLRITVIATDGLPYGKYPRLALAYIITQAVEREGRVRLGTLSAQEARRIPLGNSLNAFLRAIGLSTRGGGTVIPRVRDQIDRLAACSIKVENIAKTALTSSRDAEPAMEISNHHRLWLSPHPEQPALTKSYIELTEEFYEELVASPIPIDLRILNQLTKPRAMDIYTWLALKKYWLSKRPVRDYTFTWETLAGHFSPKPLTDWIEWRNFRYEIKKCVASIEELWPEVGVKVTAEGLLVHQGPTPIPPRPKQHRNVEG